MIYMLILVIVLATNSTLVWFFTSVSPHMNNQHVLSFERSQIPGTILPSANKLLSVSVDVNVVYVLQNNNFTFILINTTLIILLVVIVFS